MTSSTTKPTIVPSIPKPPSGISPELARYLEALSEAIEIRLGRRGDPRDRAVTARELVDSGVAVEYQYRPYVNNSGVPTFVNPSSPLAVSRPTAPTSFTATGAYETVVLGWDFARYSGHSQTEVWRHDSDSIGDAQLLAVTTGRSYTDNIGSDSSYYYWVRHINIANVPGPFNSSNGTIGTTAPNVDLILSELSGAITATELATALNTRINLIDDASTVVGSVDYRVAQEAAQRAAAVTLLQDQVNDLLAIEAYDNATTYAIGDQVTYNGNLYKAIAATTGNLPTDTNYWDELGNYSSLGEFVGENAAAIIELNNVSASSTSANAQALSALQSTVADPVTGLSATRATLINDYYTSAQADSAISTATTNLVSTTDLTTALGDYTTTATLTSNYYTATEADTAISTAVNTLATTVDGNTTAISTQATSINGLEAQYTVKIDNNGAVAGYGLASTTTDSGQITSEFIVNADRFSILANAGDTGTPQVPFIVTNAGVINGVSYPAGTYIADAFIRNGTITTAKIGDAQIDNAKIASLSADKITAGTLSTSRLNIDGSTLTSVADVLQVGSINASAITAGAINATVMSGTTVFANKLEGDVNQIDYFNVVGGSGFTVSASGYADILTFIIPAGTHPEGHVPVCLSTVHVRVTNNGELRFRMLMDELGTTPAEFNAGAVIFYGFNPWGNSLLRVSGNVSDRVVPGATMRNQDSSATGSCSWATYDPGNNYTTIYFVPTSGAFDVGDTVFIIEPAGQVEVSEVFNYAPTANFGYTTSLIGSLNRKSQADVEVTVQARIISGTGYIESFSGLTMGLA